MTAQELTSWPADWSAYLGQRVTLTGIALDAKSGALLVGDGAAIWIDGLDAWPAGYYLGGQRGRRVRVTGTVIARADLPVFVDEPEAPRKTGIPVRPGTDLEQAARRYLLEDATWQLLE